MYGLLERRRPVEDLQSVEYPGGRPSDVCGDAVDAVGVVFDKLTELDRFLDGRKIGAGAVFSESGSVGPVVVHRPNGRGDGGPAKLGDRGVSVAACDEFVAFARRAHGDGIQESGGLNGVGECGDSVEVELKATVLRVSQVDQV